MDVIGITKATRAQIVKRIWRYVKRHRLQDPKEGQCIIPDTKLARVMGKKGRKINVFKMVKYIKIYAYQIGFLFSISLLKMHK